MKKKFILYLFLLTILNQCNTVTGTVEGTALGVIKDVKTTYHLMGFDTDFFTPIFVISRITGWSAHIMEQHAANKLIRPLASYKGSKHRKVMQLNQR